MAQNINLKNVTTQRGWGGGGEMLKSLHGF